MVQRRLVRRLLGVELMDQVVEVEGWSARVRRWELRLRLVLWLREELHRSVVVQKGVVQGAVLLLVVQVQKGVVQLVVLKLLVLVQKEKAGVRRLVLLLRTVQVAMEEAEERLERRLLLAQKEKEPAKSEEEEGRRAVVMLPVVRRLAL